MRSEVVRGSPRYPAARGALGVLAAALSIKIYSLVLLYAISLRVPPRSDYDAFLFVRDGQTRAERIDEVRGSFLERLAPYDGQFYLDISERGYRRFGERDREARAGPPGNYAFFPLYPALVRIARRALGPRAGIAAVLLLDVALSSMAAVLLHRLASKIGVPAWRSVLLLLTFPTAIFQSLLYTESLFLLLSLAVALAAWEGRSGRAALLAYLAGLCRPQGILVSVLACPGRQGPGGPAPKTRFAAIRALLPALAPEAGLATFALVLGHSVGSPLGFLGIQGRWGREFSPGGLLAEVASPWAYVGPPLDYVALVLGVGLLAPMWKRLPWPLALYGTASVALPLSTGTILSLSRFLSVSFPHFLALAALLEGRRAATAVVLGAFIALQCLVARGAMGWLFVG